MMYSTGEISLDAMWKLAGNKGRHTGRQRTETSDSTREHDWVVGSQILTLSPTLHTHSLILSFFLSYLFT